MPFTKHNAKALGRLGGLATAARHGREHMATIGRRGFLTTCQRHYGGDRRAMLNELISRGLKALDPCPWNGHWQHYTAFPIPLSEDDIPW